jgi:hypothetical protein
LHELKGSQQIPQTPGRGYAVYANWQNRFSLLDGDVDFSKYVLRPRGTARKNQDNRAALVDRRVEPFMPVTTTFEIAWREETANALGFKKAQ